MSHSNAEKSVVKVSRDINDLIDIMAALRDPKTGCPWDIEQSCETIIPYTIEEVYEVVDAIRRNDPVDLCDELGDLLLQVIYYAQICSEKNLFSFGDVVEAITAKMIRRHPHVFGSEEERRQGMQKGQWQQIKQIEKEMRRLKKQATGMALVVEPSILSDVATVFPAPIEAMKLQDKAASVGFDWPKADEVIDKLREETAEIVEAIESNNFQNIEAELGDIYFTVINLARKLDIDPEKALARTNAKFRQRFHHVEKQVAQGGQKLEDCPLAEMEKHWVNAKE
ncbi:nucleoside triphosphate pyrophosphohydrolase [Bartonella sp. HY329]|uniref:nucleoside triphosphate pyrophosphohydrolase n=1 Tax=unclassified Bartonella TaxID=2645622 RepID=UPI0021C7511F|nr:MULTISPECIES: nucleoside triphosphate pyrophosphohydrolase [unclassified Bartonella]UXM96208.1 nucleoside triphosphate pyrophosphohydrolase [Bartonella sp. HY329]UXN10532.1 nucleoside triphosphate pyrophosphohydrolase [Bartonella sp. HY328]